MPSSARSRRSAGSRRSQCEPLVAERVVGPLGGGADRVRDAVGHPREGGRVVEVGDGDVGVALTIAAPVGLHLAQHVDGRRPGPGR